ncbi:unnamed protein product [Porites lobata]|uniref:EGF-like domain-containing protein n=1 Tax=Porites lobata TaxID=104759 RepID=A0ABN8NJS0_9CNID|nr:unnamed protein product [Porites lobata]
MGLLPKIIVLVVFYCSLVIYSKSVAGEKKYCPDSNSGLSEYRANALPLDNVVDSLTSYSRMLIDYFSLQAIFQVINFITVTQTNSVIHGQSVSLTSVFVRAGIMEMENIAVKIHRKSFNTIYPFTRSCSEVKPAGNTSLCTSNAGPCRCPKSSIGNSDGICILESYGDCKGRCKMPGTVCLVTALFKQGWHGQEICMCNGKLAGDPDRTGCRHPKVEELCKWYGSVCPPKSQCTQYGKEFYCQCETGYVPNKWNKCEDINECNDPRKCART